ncbi:MULTISPECIES: hypothetical protein [unclassified Enterobacter]|uniref:hypothetical protein n=1 Tax=unclassified Enterobacter TaxID=2608935 RepID=UPI000EF9F0C2|nr:MULTISPECIES: hypothetical protein [unclassified Enterobacter]RMA79679.1 hypothetical protein BJ885_4352 [Enterobacter sp. WP_7_1]RMA87513.1 hypothetical protein BJ886_4469 [Enterobacter sp. WP_7_2]
MGGKQSLCLSYDILTHECETTIREHLARTEILDGIGLALEQAKAYAVLSFWYRLAIASKAKREIIDADRERLMLIAAGNQTMRLH